MGKPQKMKKHKKVVKIKSQLKIELPYQKLLLKMPLNRIFSLGPPFAPPPPPLVASEGGGGSKRDQNSILGDLRCFFGGFPQFTDKNKCQIRIQPEKILKNSKFRTCVKFLLHSVM